MSDPSAFGFGQFVPGFDFLQNLSKTAAQPAAGAMPGMANWVAPTLSIEEIDKRIQELKSVLFWLEQNTTALKATIQAMEVQKMTLNTLQSMNVNMADLAKAFTAQPQVAEPAAAPDSGPAAAKSAAKTSLFTPKPAPAPENGSAPSSQATEPTQGSDSEKAPQPIVDPMQWWGALTQQFQGIAAAALKDVSADALKSGMTAANSRPGANGTSTSPRSAAPLRKAAAKKASASASKAKASPAQGVKAPAAPRKTAQTVKK